MRLSKRDKELIRRVVRHMTIWACKVHGTRSLALPADYRDEKLQEIVEKDVADESRFENPDGWRTK